MRTKRNNNKSGNVSPVSLKIDSAEQIHGVNDVMDSDEFDNSCREKKQSYLQKILIENRVSQNLVQEYILLVKKRID